jgi:hypothetical protein
MSKIEVLDEILEMLIKKAMEDEQKDCEKDGYR